MKRLRIYVDTSVIGGVLDEEFTEESKALLDMAGEQKITLLISDLLTDELTDAPENVKDVFDSLPETSLERIFMSWESAYLRDQYIAGQVLPSSSMEDAHHVALATVAGADLIVSWNFKHIVHYDKIRGFNAINLQQGYKPIEIRSPREIV